MSYRNAPRSERAFALVTVNGERVPTVAPSFIDRKQRIARKNAAAKSLERREAKRERRYDRGDAA